MLAAIYHHFNRHHYCGQWCPHQEHSDLELTTIYKYRDVDEDSTLLKAMMKIHDIYMFDERLLELWHYFNSQQNEALNKSITKYAPKYKERSTTMSLLNRVAAAVGVGTAPPPNSCSPPQKVKVVARSSRLAHSVHLRPGHLRD